jgi:tetratricopeptide (TPR) repeat protein
LKRGVCGGFSDVRASFLQCISQTYANKRFAPAMAKEHVLRIMARLAIIITVFLSFLAPFTSKIYGEDSDLNKARQLFSKGEALYTENELDHALRYYLAALDLYPFMSKAYYRIGVIYGPSKNRYKKGIEFFRKSIKYDSQDPNAYHGLGITYFMAGHEHLGSEFLLKAGMMFLRQGNITAALSIYDVLSQTKEKDHIEKLARAIENGNASEFLSVFPRRCSK